ncbi:hypothetical protein CK203_044288 [Vitis vinifera]|uniref:Uncharacterized protein n=1 Tax=Vitis vinifera TaxID=29760 RepID=A0A438GVD5_VITVI|nr:hypothetical protein CK203_044288 [Vitis vinifera]
MSLFLLYLSLEGGAAEMIERPIETGSDEHVFEEFASLGSLRHLTGVPFQDFRSLVQALFDVDDGISRGLWPDIIPSLDTEGKGGVISYPYSIVILIQLSSILLCILILSRCDLHFIFRRPQTSIPRHEQSRPHRRRQRTYSDLEMLWIELLSDSELLMEATVLIIVLLYVIPYRILLIVVQLAFPYRPQTLIFGSYMTADSFRLFTNAVLLLRAYTIRFGHPGH